MDTAEYHYGRVAATSSQSFRVNRDKIVFRRAFQVNTAANAQEVIDRALGFARMMGEGYRLDKKKNTVSVPVTWQYQGGMNECIEDMDLEGKLLIEVRGTKTRISLTDIRYKHRDRDNGEAKPVAKSDIFSRKPDCAPKEGQAELLYNCNQCRVSLSSLDRHLEARFDDYAAQYQDRLRKY